MSKKDRDNDRIREVMGALRDLGSDLSDLARANGGVIATDDDGCDSIHARIYNYDTDAYEEHRVLAIRGDGKDLWVRVNRDRRYESETGLTEADLLAEDLTGGNWEKVVPDSELLDYPGTLVQIGDYIEEYLKAPDYHTVEAGGRQWRIFHLTLFPRTDRQVEVNVAESGLEELIQRCMESGEYGSVKAIDESYGYACCDSREDDEPYPELVRQIERIYYE